MTSLSAERRDLDAALERSGFYPMLVADVVHDALDGRAPLSHVVQLETHFDRTEVHRHITVLVLTEDMLVVAHVDDQQLDDAGEHVMAQISTESVPVSQIRSVVLSYVYAQPQNYTSTDQARELTLAIAWTGGQRLDMGPAGCADPECDADHGYTGTIAQEDIVLRVSVEADGAEAVENAKFFARSLRKANTGPAGTGHAAAPEAQGSVTGRFSRNRHLR
ncbi:DUF5998 family protein [Arthrobacter roseus]|uniref:DUF5998 family protein n=1 Tax=Arthrobacter roseus TaxID=136274 RepID=UPI001EF89888|nr:DUF5998 family protein [Arthrobacter roseus]MBM7848379.1 hypothetical protein [Arthrobacter roseus]